MKWLVFSDSHGSIDYMRRAVETDNGILENLRVLKQVKTELNRTGTSVTVLHKHLEAEQTALRLGQKANSIDYETSYSYHYVIRFLENILDVLNRKGVSESQEAFQQIKAAYDASAAAHRAGIANIKARLENLFQLVEEAFEDGQEMLILVMELTVRYYCVKFISKFGCDAYFKHNQNLMFYQRKQELLVEIAVLEEL